MTVVLGIDTSTPIASIAIVKGDITLALTHQETRGSDLLIMIDAACAGANVRAHELDAVAVGAGPGSFTGLRIGMATAKGIAFAAGKPLWAVSSLAALARGELFADTEVTVVCAVLDARRGEIYAGLYERQGDALVALGDERVMPPGDLAAFAGSARCIGDYADAVASVRTPSGADVARLALAGARADVLVAGAPAYIRKAEAEIMYPDGVPGALRRR